jgi:hypothetical protein
MSSNRLSYDPCATKKNIEQSTEPLSYIINPIKYENCNKCRMELGIVGGTAVSHIRGNLVDLENDLRGQTRIYSICPEKQFKSSQCNNDVSTPSYKNICSAPSTTTIDTELIHLPPCQMIRYPSVPLPPPMNIQQCNTTPL